MDPSGPRGTSPGAARCAGRSGRPPRTRAPAHPPGRPDRVPGPDAPCPGAGRTMSRGLPTMSPGRTFAPSYVHPRTRCGRFPAHTWPLVAVCQAVDTHSYAAESRRCSFRGVQRQPHRQATPIGPGAAQAPGSEEHDGRAGGRASSRLPVQDQPTGERPPLHQPARCPRPVRGVRGRGRAHGRLAHADGQGLAPAGLVARLRRHPVQRLHRPGDGRREPADVRAADHSRPPPDPRLRGGRHHRRAAGVDARGDREAGHGPDPPPGAHPGRGASAAAVGGHRRGCAAPDRRQCGS